VLKVHHLTLDLILNHVNESQLGNNTLRVEYRPTLIQRNSTILPLLPPHSTDASHLLAVVQLLRVYIKYALKLMFHFNNKNSKILH